MEMEVCQKIDLEFEADGLIGDKQFAENSVGFNAHEMTGGLDIEKEVDKSISVNEIAHLPELHESLEPERNLKNGRYNLRKSLAWDSAFFTNAGVLDAEELSTMITGAEKSEKHLLPGIQEEITGSTESISTGSDTLTMETFEDDLFVDIRASIQRSSKKASDLRSSISNIATVEVDSAAISSLKKEDLVPKNKIPKPGIKKTNSLQAVRMSKCQPKQNIGRLGSEKTIKQDSVHSQAKQTSMAKIGLAKSILPKPPKIISSSTLSSTAAGKRDPVGTGRVKSGILNPGVVTVSAKGTQPPKVSSLGGARRPLPKPMPSSNSYSASSTTSIVHSTRSSTSSDSSGNIPSRTNPGKSNLVMPRRNMAKSANVCTGPSGSIPKTPSRATLKNKLPSSYKISSSVSPASSISEWSSASSSSSMVNQKSSNSRTSIDTSSCRSTEGDIVPLDPRKPSADGHDNHAVILTSNVSKKSSTQAGSNLHAPAKPSGLRMPSHKFGFFDGVKSSAPSPNNRPPPSPSAVHKQASPKNGPATGVPVRSSNSKPKNAKLPPARTVTSPASIKPSSSKPTSPASFREKKSTDATNSPGSSVGVKQVVATTGCAIIEDSLGDLKINTTPVVVDVMVDKNHLKKDFGSISEAADVEGGRERYVCENVNGSIHELLSNTSGCAPIASETEVCRAPLALKNSFVSSDMPNEVADKTGLLLPVSEQKENS